MDYQDPQILHLSYRENREDAEYRWLRVNIVFRVFDEHDRAVCDAESSEWTRTYLWEVDEPEKITLHFANTRIKWSEPDENGNSALEKWITEPEYDISHTKREGWQSNFDSLLRKVEKFDVYRYSDYVEDNPATRGALAMLENLKEDGTTTSRFVPFSTLIRCLRVLNVFWD